MMATAPLDPLVWPRVPSFRSSQDRNPGSQWGHLSDGEDFRDHCLARTRQQKLRLFRDEYLYHLQRGKQRGWEPTGKCFPPYTFPRQVNLSCTLYVFSRSLAKIKLLFAYSWDPFKHTSATGSLSAPSLLAPLSHPFLLFSAWHSPVKYLCNKPLF